MSMINIFRDYFGKDRLLQAVQVKGDDYQIVAQATAQIMNEVHAPTSRPGDTEPRPYVDNARERLTSTRDTYTKELDALVKDIAKLEEERRQLEIAIKGVDAALSVVGQETEPTIDEELMAAEIDRDLFDAV